MIKMTLEGSREVKMKVMDLIDGDIVLLQNTQDRMAVLESIGLPHLLHEYPTLFVKMGEGEYVKVWGLDKVIPYLDYEVEELYSAK
jgi:hypothetical protein